MELRTLGSTGMKVTPLGLGGAEIGFDNPSSETISELLNSALDAGLNVIDTAECYMDSEQQIGASVSHRRNDFYLFTKCGHPHGSSAEGADWTPNSLLGSIERSLKRLKTDYVDLVQLHSCSEDVLRQGDAIAALETARERGYTKFIGYSGDGSAAKYAIDCGRFDTLQTSLSIADQEPINLTLPLAQKANMGVIIKRPIANAAWKTGAPPEEQYHMTYWNRLKELDYDFLTGPLPDAVAKALRFTLSQPGVHTAIVGTSNPKRWKQNAAIVEAGMLSDTDITAIRERWNAVAKPDWVGQT